MGVRHPILAVSTRGPAPYCRSEPLRLSEDLSIVVEIVDCSEKIASLLPHLDEMVSEGMMTLEKVRIIAYRHGDQTTLREQ